MIKITFGLSEGQVLQRLKTGTATAQINGECSASGPLQATLLSGQRTVPGWKSRRVGAAVNGTFKGILSKLPSGGPYELHLKVQGETLKIKKFFVGDVWLMAGQSNMEGFGNLDAAPSPHPKVHALYMDGHWGMAREPIHFTDESPDPVHCGTPHTLEMIRHGRKIAVKGVGSGIYFGKELVRRTKGIPQGLIAAAHGGTTMEEWNPKLKHLGGKSLYGSMLRVVRQTGQPVAGMLWYQGESESSLLLSQTYTRSMVKFVSSLRQDLRQPKLPFIMAQLNKVFSPNYAALHWNSIQDQQLRLKKLIPNLEVVATIDLGLDDRIHVSSEGHARLGVRFARVADRLVHGNLSELPPPELKSIKQYKTKTCPFCLELTFKNVVGNLSPESIPGGFSLINAQHESTPVIYKMSIRRNRVHLQLLRSPINPEFSGLMYGHGYLPYCLITDERDMAIPVFGPIFLEKPRLFSPYINQWNVSRIIPRSIPLKSLPLPKPEPALELNFRNFGTDFINMHDRWNHHSGMNYFFTKISFPKSETLNLCLGYDGPIKVWLEGKLVWLDPKGTNPAMADQHIRRLQVRKGIFPMVVAMDLNQGRAWGFYLRFCKNALFEPNDPKADRVMPVVSV